MAWTDQMVEDLKKMWKEGLTTGEIGKRLGVSKNSIVGKVHRLGLSGRPSPIKKKTDAAPQEAKKETSPQNSKTEAAPADVSMPQKESPAVKATEKKAPAVEKEEISEPLAFKSTPRYEISREGKIALTELDNHTCRWPIGDPKDENFHFCGRRVRLGQTYCEEHAALAYVKPINKK